MIEVRDMSVAYGDFKLRDVSVKLHEGGCLAILGPSGAGKTLLLETAMGARRPQRGQVLLNGRDITLSPPEARHIAYIPQDLALFPHLCVRDNIIFGFAARRARCDADGPLKEIAALLRIERLLARKDVSTLSGGERQRVALARALILKPRVLFLDEPFASMDAASRADLLRAFRSLRRTLKMTVFLVTHDLEEASFLADDVAIMMAGRIVQSGSRDDVIHRPRSISVARFLNYRNILPLSAIPAGSRNAMAGSWNGMAAVAIRPESVQVEATHEERPEFVRGRLIDVMSLGTRIVAELELPDSTRIEALLPIERMGELTAWIGKEVSVRLPHEAMLPLEAD